MALNILHRQKIELTGLDIGTSAVKLVRLCKSSEGYTLGAALAEPITQCPEDEQQQRQNCLDAVKACLRKSNLQNSNVVCGISGPEVVVRGFTFPPLPDAAVEQAVNMEAQQVCPLDMNHSALDFQLIETAADQSSGTSKARPRRGVMAVGTDRIIADRIDLVKQAGAKTMMVDVNALALMNCLNELELIETQETVAVIDIGCSLTNVVIYGSDGLPFVRDINTAGKTVLEQISQDLDLSEKEIWQMLTQDHSRESLDSNLLLALNNAVAPLANAVNETLRFYSFQEKRSGVDRVILCGGFALIDEFSEFLTDALPMSVSLLNPFTKITCGKNDNEKQALLKNGPVYATAMGLAMRTI